MFTPKNKFRQRSFKKRGCFKKIWNMAILFAKTLKQWCNNVHFIGSSFVGNRKNVPHLKVSAFLNALNENIALSTFWRVLPYKMRILMSSKYNSFQNSKKFLNLYLNWGGFTLLEIDFQCLVSLMVGKRRKIWFMGKFWFSSRHWKWKIICHQWKEHRIWCDIWYL